jgi:alpha-D-xyloside xylohydrolase
MVAELAKLGVRLMVSVWPSVSTLSENYQEMLGQGLLVATEQGTAFHTEFPDRSAVPPAVSFYDPTNPAARAYFWGKLRDNYYGSGIRVFWLDACEPEIVPGHPRNLRFHAGPGEAVANRYPLDHARAVDDGMRAAGEDEIITLCRSAWAGSQRHGAAVWSGDIGATFEALRAQIAAGLNIGLSGIPWWTSDIGGFHGGDPDDPDYRELVIRWFQYGVWCPLFRLHGDREPRVPLGTAKTGGPNEAWSYGDEAYAIIAELLLLRERIRPYVLEQMRLASEHGTPPMRPLWFDDPGDDLAWTIEDEFAFGPDVVVAPITELGARARDVYLPRRADWRHLVTGETFRGGVRSGVDAPLNSTPVFVRDGAEPGFC